MQATHVIEIVTPKKIKLNGLWFGPKGAKRVIVWIHGLGSSAFTRLYIVEQLVDKQTAVITFNNRGHDKVTSVSSVSGARLKGGASHEIFTDCVDDIEGALRFARKNGAKKVFLAGHSTGCQKSIYWASKKGRGVQGIVILAPLSDYSAERMEQGVRALKRAEKVARKYMRDGKKHEMLPESVWGWPWIADAQRFLSLYSGDSAEEIFTYWDPKRNPKTLKSVRLPILVLLAEKDEYADRPAKKMGDWFAEHIKLGDQVLIIPKVTHGFQGGEKVVAKAIRSFMKDTR